MNIIIITKRSAIALFLFTNVFSTLYALPIAPKTRLLQNEQNYSLHQDIEDILINRGLETDAARKKVKDFFKENHTLSKLVHLFTSKKLQVSKKKLNLELAKLALFNKKVNFNSYNALYKIVQDTKREPLNQSQRDELQVIATL